MRTSPPIVRISLLAYAAAVAIGAVWWAANLAAIPAYGDAAEYVRLARTLRVDRYRTVFFPLVLRGTQEVSDATGVPYQTLLYLLQTGVALWAAAYLFTTLWRVTERSIDLSQVSVRARRCVVG
jgi:hypothetical protein